jgi:hypothetical protein
VRRLASASFCHRMPRGDDRCASPCMAPLRILLLREERPGQGSFLDRAAVLHAITERPRERAVLSARDISPDRIICCSRRRNRRRCRRRSERRCVHLQCRASAWAQGRVWPCLIPCCFLTAARHIAILVLSAAPDRSGGARVHKPRPTPFGGATAGGERGGLGRRNPRSCSFLVFRDQRFSDLRDRSKLRLASCVF